MAVKESAAIPASIKPLVEAATYAPSGDNCQPWRFHWDGEYLRVLFVPERAESFYDVLNAASWISLGAVLENLELAATTRGLRLNVELFPNGDARGAVARTTVTEGPSLVETLAAAIPLRCSNRRPYERRPLPMPSKAELDSAVTEMSGIQLSWVEERRQKTELARLAAQNDRFLFEHRPLHDGLYKWLRWTSEEVTRTRDGMPIETLELSLLERPAFRLAGCWPWARGLSLIGITRFIPVRSARIYARSAAIGLVSVDGGAVEDFVRGGRAVQRVWLTATLRGMAFQPITGITFLLLRLMLANGEGLSKRHRGWLVRLQRELHSLFPVLKGSAPVMLFRVGFGPPPSQRSLRLPLADVYATDII